MKGKIVKGISGFYYVHVAETGIYECKAKGIFRNQKIKPLVGDDVEIVVLDEEKKIGNVEKILPRTRELIRPAVANIDMALVIFAAAKPDPNFNLLDRFLCMMEYQKVPVTICFNKCDLVTEEQREVLRKIYELAGYELLFTSAKTQENVEKLKSVLQGKMTAVAGPSGVGKSSLINDLQDAVQMQTGRLSGENIRHAIRRLYQLRKTPILWILRGLVLWICPDFPKRICGHVIRSSCVLSLDADLSDAVTSESRIVALRLHLQKEKYRR